jgi:hypothetical protein
VKTAIFIQRQQICKSNNVGKLQGMYEIYFYFCRIFIVRFNNLVNIKQER